MVSIETHAAGKFLSGKNVTVEFMDGNDNASSYEVIVNGTTLLLHLHSDGEIKTEVWQTEPAYRPIHEVVGYDEFVKLVNQYL